MSGFFDRSLKFLDPMNSNLRGILFSFRNVVLLFRLVSREPYNRQGILVGFAMFVLKLISKQRKLIVQLSSFFVPC